MRLHIEFGYLCIAIRSRSEETGIHWSGQRSQWSLGVLSRDDERSSLQPLKVAYLDRYGRRWTDRNGGACQELQAAVGRAGLYWAMRKEPEAA